jgi:hypothetical protein
LGKELGIGSESLAIVLAEARNGLEARHQPPACVTVSTQSSYSRLLLAPNLRQSVLSWVYAETTDFGNARRWVEDARSLAEQTNLHVLDAQFDQIDALIADAHREPLQELIEKFLNGSSVYGRSWREPVSRTAIPTMAVRLLWR